MGHVPQAIGVRLSMYTKYTTHNICNETSTTRLDDDAGQEVVFIGLNGRILRRRRKPTTSC